MELGWGNRSSLRNFGRAIGVSDHDHLVAHRQLTRSFGTNPREQTDQCIGPPLLRSADLIGPFATAIGVVDLVGGCGERRPRLRPADRIELGVKHGHAGIVVEYRDSPGRSTTTLALLEVVARLMSTSPFAGIAGQQIGGPSGGIGDQLRLVDSSGRSQLSGPNEGVDVFGRQRPGCQGLGGSGHFSQPGRSASPTIGLTL